MQLAAIVKKQKINISKKGMDVIEILSVIAVGCWYVCRNQWVLPLTTKRMVDISLCILIVYIFSVGQGIISKIMDDDMVIYLGKISSYVFIIHFVIITYIDILFEKNRWIMRQWTGIVELLLIITMVVISCKCIEKGITKLTLKEGL